MFGSSGLYAYAGANAATAAISLNVLQGFAGLFEASVSRTAYVNYLTSGSNTTSTAIAGTATKLLVGARYTTAGAIGNYLDGWVTACAFYERALSAAEILTTYRQMAYCHVNPDWSAWSRRRKWFYAAGEPGEITGQAAVALANLSPSAAGTVDIAGAAAATLANLTGQSAGAVEILGAAGTALANVASQAAGIVDIAGSGAANLAELLPSAEGSVTAAGAAAITLAGTTGAATASIGEAPITGQGEVTLANPAAQGTGGVAVSGAGNITLAGLTGQAAGAVSISGAAGVTLAGMVELAAGQASISGSAAEQFAEMVSAAAGVVVGYIPATQYIGLSLARRSFEWHISERAKDL